MKDYIQILLFIGACCLIAVLAYGSFKTARWFNWEYIYKEKVTAAIHETVKPECLKIKEIE